MHTLIIGSGLAGITLARELRKLDKERAITLVTADDGNFYSKPNLSNAFAAGKPPESMVLTPANKLAADLGVTILTHTPVAAIDAEKREIVYPQGRLAYDQLVLAVGASQVPLPLAGDGVADVLSVNSLADYARLRRALEGRQSVAIVGAGLIGCEFANDLRLGNFDVDLFDVASLPLARLLPESAALSMREKLKSIGVGFHLSTRLMAIRREGDAFVLIDSDGNARKYDRVLSAIGLRPNLGLAKSANLETRTGIVTDAYLRTSDPNIYAIGDCIEIGGQYLPYVMPIMQGAKKLAATLNGMPEVVTYPAMPIVVKTPACPTVISPPASGNGCWEEEVTDEGVRALYIDTASGKAHGFVLQGAFTKERMALAARMPGLGES
jgi:rubredoxin-NAD+ reductase